MNEFDKEIAPLFNGVMAYKEDRIAGTVSFKIDGSGFRAEQLWKLSDIVGTANINITTEIEYHGYCETCSWEEQLMVFTCNNVKFTQEIS